MKRIESTIMVIRKPNAKFLAFCSCKQSVHGDTDTFAFNILVS